MRKTAGSRWPLADSNKIEVWLMGYGVWICRRGFPALIRKTAERKKRNRWRLRNK